MHKLTDYDYHGKKVLLRVDLNVPLLNGKIIDETRINKIIPTIKYLQSQEAKIILISHFGRPKAGIDPQFSLEFLKNILSNKLNEEVIFSANIIGDKTEELVNNLNSKQVLLLENLRFHPGETKNDPEFAASLARLADFYVNDAFSCSHRAHASIDKITDFLPAAAGLLLEQEVEGLSRYLLAPEQPMLAIIGGSKISTKLTLIEALIKQVDYLVIGGAMANTFLRAQGYDIGNSFYEEGMLELAYKLAKNPKIILPVDAVIADNIAFDAQTTIASIGLIPQDKQMLDIGPQTILQIIKLLQQCKLVIMNGPLGVFEYPQFAHGTFAIVREIGKLTSAKQLISIAGGGDSIAALTAAGSIAQFTYISTAGGAFLEWLESKNLIGLAKL